MIKNIKRIITEQYDNCLHIEEEPNGVQDIALFDGELFTADGYGWILLNNFGVAITTDCGDVEDLGEHSEETLKHIEYLLEDAPKRGYIEDATENQIKQICEFLGEIYEG